MLQIYGKYNMHTFQKSWVRTEDEQLIEDLEKFYSISIKGRRHGPVMLDRRRRCGRRFSCQPLAPPGAACELCGAAEVKTREMRRVSAFDFDLRWG